MFTNGDNHVSLYPEYSYKFALVKVENFPNTLLVLENEFGNIAVFHYDGVLTYTGHTVPGDITAFPKAYLSKDLQRLEIKETTIPPRNWDAWDEGYEGSLLVETYYEVGRTPAGEAILNYGRCQGLQGPLVQHERGLYGQITNHEGSNIIQFAEFNGQETALSDQDFQAFIAGLEPLVFKDISEGNYWEEVENMSR